MEGGKSGSVRGKLELPQPGREQRAAAPEEVPGQ